MSLETSADSQLRRSFLAIKYAISKSVRRIDFAAARRAMQPTSVCGSVVSCAKGMHGTLAVWPAIRVWTQMSPYFYASIFSTIRSYFEIIS